ncbi:ATP-binding protein [Micromonospora sp. NPDC005206]|uniref:ATP-binding protein n=1 Tax=Micromonospora sp. NPDC005206 TaxID=3157022 RepID=UPI0033B69995
MGRLLWLKAFRHVEVLSVFKEAGQFKSRSFRFTAQDGVTDHEVKEVAAGDTFAEVSLLGFSKSYQQSSRKMGSTIARNLLEHCLWYFVREGGAPDIVVFDNGEAIDLHVVFEDYMKSSSKIDRVVVKGKKFDLIHLKLKTSAKSVPSLNWCAANRVVVEESIAGKIMGLHGPLADDEGDFIYSGYLTSAFLDERVRPERTDFDLEETATGVGEESEFTQDNLAEEPSRSEIRQALLRHVEEYLSDSLTAAREKGRDRVETFVSRKAPRYRPVLRRIDEKGLGLDPTLSDKDLELELHKRLADFEAEVLREGQEVLGEATILNLTDEEYNKRLDEYLAKVEDVKKSDLAAYVSRRKLILDLLARVIEQQPDGRYCREDLIHNLIMPMRTTSEDDAHRASNLWIIDERLAFHNYLASDKSLRSMPITGSTSTREPDLLALQTCDAPVLVAEGDSPRWASLSIIEIKRPMRNDASAGESKDPIEQCLNYLQRVRDGGVRTAKGRPIPGVDRVPGFCYIIADLTTSLISRCRMHRLNPTDDGMGFFGYHEHFNAYIEVISFDRLLSIANQRNRAFFDVVGLPSS